MSPRILSLALVILALSACATRPAAQSHSGHAATACPQSVVITRIDGPWDESIQPQHSIPPYTPIHCAVPNEYYPRPYSFADDLAAQIVVGFMRGMLELVVRAALNAH